MVYGVLNFQLRVDEQSHLSLLLSLSAFLRPLIHIELRETSQLLIYIWS